MKLDLQIVRHGKTEAVDKMIYCGYTDLPLNQHGIDEINQFIDEGFYHEAETYYSSGLKRAVETLMLIRPDIKFKKIPELKEYNFGEFELQKHDDLLHNKKYQEWINDETGTYIVPNGESLKTFHARVDHGFKLLFQDIVTNQSESVLLTTHGGVIARFITKFHDPSIGMYDAMPSHGRGYVARIELDADHTEIIDIRKI